MILGRTDESPALTAAIGAHNSSAKEAWDGSWFHVRRARSAMVKATLGRLGIFKVEISMVLADIDAGWSQTEPDALLSVDIDIHAVWPLQAQLSPGVRFIVYQLVKLAARGRPD